MDALSPERILLFGSHAWGIPNDDSDVDFLVIVAESDLPTYKRARLGYRALRGIRMPKDILVLTKAEFEQQARLSCSLPRRALESGKILYDRRQSRGHVGAGAGRCSERVCLG